MSLISLVRTNRSSNLKNHIEKSVDLINFHFNSNIHKVVIKANMCYYWDYSIGETTSPLFVSGLIDFLRERLSSPEVYIVESDASAMKCKHAFRMLGYEKLANKKGVNLINLSKDENKEIKVTTANKSYKFLIPATIKNADLFINVPKIKYMAGTLISCALKNIYGCNPYPQKFKYHSKLDEVIVALNKIMKPDLCLVDGVIVRGQHTKKLGLIMASEDSVSTDSAAAKIIGLNPKKIRHIVLAEKEGLGRIRYKTIGENIEYFAQRFPRKDQIEKIEHAIIKLGVSVLRKARG